MAQEYETISNILKRYKTEKIVKINFFGVITFLGPTKEKHTQVTVVDNSCEFNEKLKCIIFINKNDEHTIRPTCNIGDILRCHRFRVQEFNCQAQGVGYTVSNWARFKSDSNDFYYEGAKQNTTVEENDKKIITELREWLKTNPQLESLFEANLATENKSDENVDENILDAAANAMHMINEIKVESPKIKTEIKDLIQFFKIQPNSYNNLICQVCAVGYHAQNDTQQIKILSVWDGTKTSYTVYQEQGIQFDANINTYFSHAIVEQTYQIFVFDEYVKKCESIRPGDFILLRNQHATKHKNIADLIFKIPDGGSNYNRNIIKLASHDLTFENTNYNDQVTATIKNIHEKGKEFNLKFMCLEEYKSYFKLNLNDNTLDEIMNENEINKPAEKVLTKVDMLLNDETIMYDITDDESTTGSAQDADQNKENKVIMESFDINTNLMRSSRQIMLNTSLSPIVIKTNNIQNTLDLMDAITEENIKETNVSTSTQIVKKTKKVDPYEICSDIFKIKRLTLLTYLVPSYSCDLNYLSNIDSIPFFLSMDHLKKHSEKVDFMRCKIEAKIFKYSFNSCPQMSCVFVNCKKCNYINFTPFNLATTHQRQMMNAILKDLKNDENQPNHDLENDAINFSLNWIHSTLPEDFIEPNQMPSEQSQEQTPIMYYPCPRCKLANESEEDKDEEEYNLLDYIYRFWFDLRDAHSSLNPVLIEGQVAESLLNITPIKYYTDKNKAHQVYQLNLENFDKKFIFTIDTFKLPDQKKYHINKKLNVLYKIVEMTEIKIK